MCVCLSLVSFVFFLSLSFYACVAWFCCVGFSLVSTNCQEIGWEERLRVTQCVSSGVGRKP